MISLFGFLVVLGIVVDDAVVVGENVYERRLSAPSDNEGAAVDRHTGSCFTGGVQHLDQHRGLCAADVHPGGNRKVLGATAGRRDYCALAFADRIAFHPAGAPGSCQERRRETHFVAGSSTS